MLNSERTMDLMLLLNNNSSSDDGILWCGLSGRSIGKLDSCNAISLQLSIVAVKTGLLVSSSEDFLLTWLALIFLHIFAYRNVAL